GHERRRRQGRRGRLLATATAEHERANHEDDEYEREHATEHTEKDALPPRLGVEPGGAGRIDRRRHPGTVVDGGVTSLRILPPMVDVAAGAVGVVAVVGGVTEAIEVAVVNIRAASVTLSLAAWPADSDSW